MGLFSFLKNAGAALIGGKKETKEPVAPTTTGTDAMKQLEDSQLAMRLTNHVVAMGLKVQDLNIVADGDHVVVSGVAESQSEREKVILTVGNVAGVATVDDRMTVSAEAPEQEAVFYEVKKGDTLSKISKEHYGSANKYMVIFEANKPMLKDPDKIYPGQMLRIPPLN